MTANVFPISPSPAGQTGVPRRRLVALMFTDIVGYSALAAFDEGLAFKLLEEHRVIFRRIFPAYGGRENKTIGDAFFIEFGSVVEAVQCAIEIQTAFYERNLGFPEDRKILVRIGLHLGDVIDSEGDTYGEGVNLAARVEGLASPGGVCMTRQVVDQIAASKISIPVARVGKAQVKNIADPVEVYRIKFPWESERPRFWHVSRRRAAPSTERRKIKSWGGVLVGTLYGLCAGVLGITFVVASQYHGSPRLPDRRPGFGPSGIRLDLSKGWQYSLAGSPSNAQQWQEFDSTAPWRYSDRLHGAYLLRKEFDLGEGSYRFPAFVLGLISGSHRVYLNGSFVGGSTYFNDLQYFAFDRALLRPHNVILVEGSSPPSLNPGLTKVAQVGTFIGEFEDTYGDVMRDRLTFHVGRSIYLALSLLIGLACAALAFFQQERGKYLYFSLFLLLGSMALCFDNALVSGALEYHFHRLLKVMAFSLSSFVLFSTTAYLRRRRPLEVANNAAALGFAALMAGLLLGTDNASVFVFRYDLLLGLALLYTVLWVSAGAVALLRERFSRIKAGSKEQKVSRIIQATILLFGFMNGALLFSSLKIDGTVLVPSETLRAGLEATAIVYPFLFAMMVFAVGVLDYSQKFRRLAYTAARDDLILNIVKIVSEGRDLESTIAAVQDRVNQFIGAERSTVYLAESGIAPRNYLKATYIYGASAGIREQLERVIQPTTGILGYVCQTRAPLLIRDLATDTRFAGFLKKREAGGTYKTNSCMIFPLVTGSAFVGILTVADKRDGCPFQNDDFALMHVVAKGLSLFINNKQLQEQLKSYLAA